LLGSSSTTGITAIAAESVIVIPQNNTQSAGDKYCKAFSESKSFTQIILADTTRTFIISNSPRAGIFSIHNSPLSTGEGVEEEEEAGFGKDSSFQIL
jgi:hypothetical protein